MQGLRTLAQNYQKPQEAHAGPYSYAHPEPQGEQDLRKDHILTKTPHPQDCVHLYDWIFF